MANRGVRDTGNGWVHQPGLPARLELKPVGLEQQHTNQGNG